MSQVQANSVNLSNTCYRNNLTIINVDLNNVAWTNNSMCDAFYNCQNLSSVTNINQNVTNMCGAFPFTSIRTAPIIPNSVIDMSVAFSGCTNLINAPVIPNSVTNMSYTFQYCFDLVNAPVIPNSVTNMSSTFYFCNNLVNAPTIPDSVTYMSAAFSYCTNLASDIEIYSEDITSAQDCFEGTSLDKNVYIPFQNNGVNTLTFNSFKAAGYSEETRKIHGVLLKDLNAGDIYLSDYTYTVNETNDVKLTDYTGSATKIVTPHLS